MAELHLDEQKVCEAREAAAAIVRQTVEELDDRSTVTVERTVLRLMGIDGINDAGVPLPNLVIERLQEEGLLGQGASYWMGRACLALGKSPQEVAELCVQGDFSFRQLEPVDSFQIRVWGEGEAEKSLKRILASRSKRDEYFKRFGDHGGPLLYVIVATGNIYEDIVQAKAAAKQGADVIAVIRTTGQSLLDYVPYGATTEGFGGTMATQENFRLMRKALDESGEELHRYIRLCNYCSGLCMPEIAVMGAFERLDVMLNDALYGILFRDINMQRTLIDQRFSRLINGVAGVIINTGEDNYLTTADAFEEAHTVLASQFINEQFALDAGMPEEQMGLGHAFEMDPELENAFLYEFAQAQMARQIFPHAPLKYMPPTKYMTGNIFRGHIQDALFNIITVISKQRIHLLGMLTEAIHTPFMSDRALSIENARYIARSLRDFGDDISFKPGGIMEERAAFVLDQALELLRNIQRDGLFRTLELGRFADIKRPLDGGKGLAGVFRKEENYLNPFHDLFMRAAEDNMQQTRAAREEQQDKAANRVAEGREIPAPAEGGCTK